SSRRSLGSKRSGGVRVERRKRKGATAQRRKGRDTALRCPRPRISGRNDLEIHPQRSMWAALCRDAATGTREFSKTIVCVRQNVVPARHTNSSPKPSC